LEPAWGAPPEAAARSASGRPAPGEPAPNAAATPVVASVDAAEAALARADETIRKAGEATAANLGPATREAASAVRETTLNVAAQRLARDLAEVPGIERFGSLRLGQLDQTGPRPLRTMWRIARDQLAERYGQMTIGEIVDRFGPGGPGAGGPSASA